MKISGSCLLDAPREQVYAAIYDPGALLAIIPGCQEIRQVGPGEYHGQISLRLPAVVGVYQTVMRVLEAQPPCSSQFEGQVDGTLGTIKGKACFTLIDQGAQTRMDYQGEGQITGSLARLNTRFTEGLAKTLIDQGLAQLNKQLQEQEMPK
jgi:carbon monoxide dehydrogenase subunit G